MNTSTLLCRSLLLVVLLAVSWAAAVPLNTLSGNKDLTEDPEAFLAQHPSIALQLYPQLLNAASDVTLFLDRDIVLDILRNHIAGQRVEEAQPHTEEEHTRSKRQTDVSLSGRQLSDGISAAVNVDHTIDDNQSLRGTLGATTHNIPDGSSFNTFNAGGSYRYTNDDTALTLGLDRNWLPGGRTRTGASATLEHSLGNGHSLSGTLQGNRHETPGDINFNTFNAGGSYRYTNDDTALTLGLDRDWLQGGRTRTGASATLERYLGNGHSLSGTLQGNRHETPGYDSFNTLNAEANYNINPDPNTRLGFGVQNTWTPSGSNPGVRFTFTRRFR